MATFICHWHVLYQNSHETFSVIYCISVDKRNVPRKCICQLTADRKDTIMNKLKPVPQVLLELLIWKLKTVYIRGHMRDVWDYDRTRFLKQVQERTIWEVPYQWDLCRHPPDLLAAARVWWPLECEGGSRVGCVRSVSFDIPRETFDHRWSEFLQGKYQY